MSNNNYYKHEIPIDRYHAVYEEDLRLVDAGVISKPEAELLGYIRGWCGSNPEGVATFSYDYAACYLRFTREAVQEYLVDLIELGLVRITGMSPYNTPYYQVTGETPVNLETTVAKPVEEDAVDNLKFQQLVSWVKKIQGDLEFAVKELNELIDAHDNVPF